MNHEVVIGSVKDMAREVFGVDKLRDGQVQAIMKALDVDQAGEIVSSSDDICLRMATGYGKSMVFQLPALLIHQRHGFGTTVVVLPTIAKINDHIRSLNKLRVAAGELSSEVDWTEKEKLLIATVASDKGPPLLYTTPESFVKLMYYHLKQLKVLSRVVRVVFDECHELAASERNDRPLIVRKVAV